MPGNLAAASTATSSVLVVDEHEASRVGLATLLSDQSWVVRCTTASSTQVARERIAAELPDVAVVDITDAGPFVGLLRETLAAPNPRLRFVFTARAGVPESAALRRTGVPLVLAQTSSETLLATIRAVAADCSSASVPQSAPLLTPRQREVLELLITGATNQEVSERLDLGPNSVKKHASALYRKLGVRNRTELAQLLAAHPNLRL